MPGRTADACAECGDAEYSRNYSDCNEKRRMDAEGLCFGCAFWRNQIDEQSDKTVIVKGQHMTIGPELPPDYRGFVGFGGQFWNVRFHDGRRATTTNMWSQGMIPERFRDRLPDNATATWRRDEDE